MENKIKYWLKNNISKIIVGMLIFIWFIIIVCMSIIVLNKNPEIEFGRTNFTLEGLKLFVSHFEYSLYMLALFIPFIGIIITIVRMFQTEKLLTTSKSQLDEIQKQNIQNIESNFNFTFFRLMDIYEKFISDYRYGDFSGRDCFKVMHQDFSMIFHKQAWLDIKDRVEHFGQIYNDFSFELPDPAKIHKHVYLVQSILKHLERNMEIVDEKIYVDTILAELSQSELLFLLYHALVMKEKQWGTRLCQFSIFPNFTDDEPLKIRNFNTWAEFEKIYKDEL